MEPGKVLDSVCSESVMRPWRQFQCGNGTPSDSAQVIHIGLGRTDTNAGACGSDRSQAPSRAKSRPSCVVTMFGISPAPVFGRRIKSALPSPWVKLKWNIVMVQESVASVKELKAKIDSGTGREEENA